MTPINNINAILIERKAGRVGRLDNVLNVYAESTKYQNANFSMDIIHNVRGMDTNIKTVCDRKNNNNKISIQTIRTTKQESVKVLVTSSARIVDTKGIFNQIAELKNKFKNIKVS